jgi:hypothetical protein
MHVLAATLPYTSVIKRAASLFAIGIPLAMLSFELVRKKPLVRVKEP